MKQLFIDGQEQDKYLLHDEEENLYRGELIKTEVDPDYDSYYLVGVVGNVYTPVGLKHINATGKVMELSLF